MAASAVCSISGSWQWSNPSGNPSVRDRENLEMSRCFRAWRVARNQHRKIADGQVAFVGFESEMLLTLVGLQHFKESLARQDALAIGENERLNAGSGLIRFNEHASSACEQPQVSVSLLLTGHPLDDGLYHFDQRTTLDGEFHCGECATVRLAQRRDEPARVPAKFGASPSNNPCLPVRFHRRQNA